MKNGEEQRINFWVLKINPEALIIVPSSITDIITKKSY